MPTPAVAAFVRGGECRRTHGTKTIELTTTPIFGDFGSRDEVSMSTAVRWQVLLSNSPSSGEDVPTVHEHRLTTAIHVRPAPPSTSHGETRNGAGQLPVVHSLEARHGRWPLPRRCVLGGRAVEPPSSGEWEREGGRCRYRWLMAGPAPRRRRRHEVRRGSSRSRGVLECAGRR